MGFLCESAGQAISSTFFLGADLGESVRLLEGEIRLERIEKSPPPCSSLLPELCPQSRVTTKES